MAAGYDRLHELNAFDDTKAGVKGLVDAGVTAVPRIFHHPPESPALHAAPPPAPEGPAPVDDIPVIDLADTASGSSRRAEVVGAVKTAAETVGFFQVVNHGVPGEVLAEVLAAVRRFHESPAEAKRPYYTRDMGRRVKYQSNFDLFQSPAANWRDTLFMEMAPPGLAQEDIPPACRSIVLEYAAAVRRLGGELLELLSEALGLRRDYLERNGRCMEGLGIAAHYYPACPEPHLTLGTTRHSDPSYLTVLLQDGGVGGLQVLHPGGGGRWVDVPPVAGALVVNVGDYLQLLSNDRFRSVEHRVVASGVGSRVSVACFFRSVGAAASTVLLQPIEELLAATGEKPRYRRVTMEEMIAHFWGKGLDGRSALDHFRL